jgi:NADPH:quinone reductase-like Zn-dependent oxidoreductase
MQTIPSPQDTQPAGSNGDAAGRTGPTEGPPAAAAALVAERYGAPDVLELRTFDVPAPEPGEVLVRVHATSVNPADCYRLAGPWFARIGAWRAPASPLTGTDLAGRVVAVGTGVTGLHTGDDVFGTGAGAWGEIARARPERLAHKPAGVSYEDAAAVPVAGITALQALRDHGRVEPGQRVLVNGASGGVGTYAIQLAKWLGTTVTAVCSTANVDLARTLGADEVVDYTREDFTLRPEPHDVLVDIAGSRPLRHLRRVLTRDATVVIVGAKMSMRGLGPLGHIAGMKLAAVGCSQTARFMIAKIATDDLALLGGLLADGTLRSVVDRRFHGLDTVPDAVRALHAGHARGKLVIAL